jgi:acetyl-CoA synthetase
VAVREHYGQTEHGMLLGNWQRDGSDSDPSSLGTALPGQNLDFGENGELLVRKDGPLFWFQGYWGLPAPEGDSIATGDLFRKLPDGTHRYCGRGDDLIKASGLRIGPSEVEAAVMARGGDWGVAECAAVPVGFGGGVAVGVVLVCRSGHSGPTLEEVRAQVERTVGGHAMPRRLLVVHEPLPRTLSGKLLRKPLAALFK